jgi:hypothetical protein
LLVAAAVAEDDADVADEAEVDELEEQAARPAVRRTLVRRSMRIMAQSLKRPSVRTLSSR